MRTKILDITVSVLGTVCLKLQPERDAASDKCISLLQKHKGNFISIEAKDPTKRSLTANAYMWRLCDEIGKATGNTKDDVYRLFIREAGVWDDVEVKREAAERWMANWSEHGTGWVCDVVDDVGEKVTIRTYYGSSTYTRSEMARLIDRIVEECKELGIETMTPNELAKLMALVKEV